MSLFALFLLAIALSFDTFAVSITCGLIERHIKFWPAARIAVYFLGLSFRGYVQEVDHWIAFGLLFIVGGKMIIESLKKGEIECFDVHSRKVIVTLAIATTIDAFAVGITFALLEINLLISSIIIGFVTFIVAMLGMLLGKKIGEYYGKKVGIAGGIILIVIGTKILIDHLGVQVF
jgi:putative Mn2+ efflux pump MntP